jgi:alanyl-tRNA synthetase
MLAGSLPDYCLIIAWSVQMLTTNQIRTAFIDFFKSKGHRHVNSSSLVPGNDPTLLFTNSGMVQFKDTFLGADQRDYTRAVSSQRCVRAGGKHNDLENVGYTARHHTFFEMLGNFSFGDYFKRDAIQFAWELLTDVYKLPKEKLWVTVYQEDDEAFEIWTNEIGIPAERVVRIGDNKGARYASDNFWQMADVGPCGPCSEIFYDHGPQIKGGPPGSPDEDGDRYIEIWNNVFMQFERFLVSEARFDTEAEALKAKSQAESAKKIGQISREGGGFKVAVYDQKPLPKPCVDTGMGLERLTAVLQHVHSNYEIDLFAALIQHASAATATPDLANPSLRVISDHIRACAFLIVDGVLPSNEGRGYVLRRIIRRALRHGWQLGQKGAFFHKLVAPLVAQMGQAYPELAAKQSTIERTLAAEESRFSATLDSGMKVFESYVAELAGSTRISGAQAFKLYDTFGFPVDLTADVARERGLEIDERGFEIEMDKQREKSRDGSKFGSAVSITAEQSVGLAATQFLGYAGCDADGCTVVKILLDGQAVSELNSADSALVILDRTPFYAESGGQIGDSGQLFDSANVFQISDTVKLAGTFFGHVGKLQEGALRVGQVLSAKVDAERRARVRGNHSATHLMHAALRQVLGEHVSQKGSYVGPDRLRFDFSHFQPVSKTELRAIERMVNGQVRRNSQVQSDEMHFDDAIAKGAMALFGEKYGDRVRVLEMGGFSTELCGGTHVNHTGDIGVFKIIAEGGVAAGVRRIEALTGAGAMEAWESQDDDLREAANHLGANPAELVMKVKSLVEHQREAQKELDRLKQKAAAGQAAELAQSAIDVAGIHVIAARLEGVESKTLRDMLDNLKSRLPDCAIVLAGVIDGKANLIAGVHGAGLAKIKAGEMLAAVAAQIGGKGGGRPDMAQGGGDDSPSLITALQSVVAWVRGKM